MPGYEERKDIGDLSYTVRRPPWKIMKKNLSLLGKVTGDSAKNAMGGNVDEDALFRLVASIVGRIDSQDINDLLDSLGSFTTVSEEGEKKELTGKNQNLHWQKYPSHFFPWLMFSLKVNYSDFLSGAKEEMLGIVSELKGKVADITETMRSLN